jgi:hypothetical protein
LQIYWHGLIWIAALRAVTFPGAMIALAMVFAQPVPPRAAGDAVAETAADAMAVAV